MNVYDFDGTIYAGDSTKDFYLYCVIKYPRVLKNIPKQLIGVFKYLFKMIDKKTFKEYFYSFLNKLYEPERIIQDFWKCYESRIYSWYLYEKDENDVIISASPEFLLEPICKKMNIKYLVASKVDINTGKYDGENCKGKEKVKRFNAVFGDRKIDKFYSDSLSDLPMAEKAERAFLIKKGKVCEWHITK